MIVALAARAGATPSTELARQYANAITGVEDSPEAEDAAPDGEVAARRDAASDGDADAGGGEDSDADAADADAGVMPTPVTTQTTTTDDDFADSAEAGLARRALADHAGELALDDDLASAALTSDELGYASPIAGAVERAEARMRRQRISLLGRFDVAVAWRHRERAPMHAPAYQADEIWLLATWRR